MMRKLPEKMILSDKDYEYLTKGIAMGVGIGVGVGLIFGEITLFFSLGGVCGILGSILFSIIVKFKNNI